MSTHLLFRHVGLGDVHLLLELRKGCKRLRAPSGKSVKRLLLWILGESEARCRYRARMIDSMAVSPLQFNASY